MFLITLILSAGAAALHTGAATLRGFSNRAVQLAGSNGVLLVDSDNTRGKSNFALSHAALVGQTARWAARKGLSGRVVLLVDHGALPDSFHLPRAGVSVGFSGPELSADDVIARDVPTLMRAGHNVMLVTADSHLATRCRVAAPPGRRLFVAPPQALLAAIGFSEDSGGGGGGAQSGGGAAGAASVGDEGRFTEAHICAIEAEMRARSELIRATRAAKRSASLKKGKRGAKSHGKGKAKGLARARDDRWEALNAALEASRSVGAPLIDHVVSHPPGGGLSAAEQEQLMGEIVRRRADLPPSERRVESTLERVVLAERMRRRLRRRRSPGNPAAGSGDGGDGGGEHAATPAELYVRHVATLGSDNPMPMRQAPPAPANGDRSGSVGVTVPVGDIDGIPTGGGRGLVAAVADLGPLELLQFGEGVRDVAEGETSALPLRTLRVTEEDAFLPLGYKGSAGAATRSDGARRERRRRRRHQQLTVARSALPKGRQRGRTEAKVQGSTARATDQIAAVADDVADVADPTGGGDGEACDGAARAGAEPVGNGCTIAIVSDTHGFDLASLSSLADAEVLIHCGDWTGVPGGPSAAQAAEQLDRWWAQHPARHKFVVRGNHDPTSASFPRSGAQYVTTAETVRVAGLTFHLAPYSRGPFRGALPPCDVLVSHVPPKNVLDRCASGVNAGSESLRAAVKHARAKPRLWICGHIHESGGAARVRFGTRADCATTVINAANANPGPAKSLVLGPILVEMERVDARPVSA